jgi:hypothetical protein
MGRQILWPLILGVTLSSIVQAVVICEIVRVYYASEHYMSQAAQPVRLGSVPDSHSASNV